MNEKILERIIIDTSYCDERREHVFRLVERSVPLAFKKFYYLEIFDSSRAEFSKSETFNNKEEAYAYWEILLRRKRMSQYAIKPFEYAKNNDKMISYSYLFFDCRFIDSEYDDYNESATYYFIIEPNSDLLSNSKYNYSKEKVPQWIHSIGYLEYANIKVEITRDNSACIFYKTSTMHHNREPFKQIDEIAEIYDFENMICHDSLKHSPSRTIKL